jgi:hypothetical protein
MRAARLAGTALALALQAAPLGAARAQAPDVADVPAGPGRIVGRVLHPQDPARAAGVDVILYAIGAGGQPGVRRTATDTEGAFRFEGVATSADVAYLVGARYAGVPFVGPRIAFAPDETERAVTLEVAERTRDARSISVEEATLRVDWVGPELVVGESFRLRNGGDRVVYVDDDERAAGAAAPFRARLPEGIARFEWPYAIDPEGLVREGREVRFFGPIYPGEQDIAFLYSLPAEEGRRRLRVELPSGAAKLVLLYPDSGLELASAGLAPGTPVELGGRSWRALEARGLAPGARLEIEARVPAPSRDPGALSIAQVRSFLELDDAALHVSEEYELVVAGGAPLVAAEGEPLLRIPLPPDTRDLRFGSDGFGGGLGFEAGALAVRGPLRPGSSRLELHYRLAPDAAGRFERRFERPVPALSLFVADTGLEVQSQRFHRRRPVRTQDARIYMHFEAFHVQPDEAVALSLAPLARPAAPPRALRAALVFAAALGLGLFLAAPLRAARAAQPGTEHAPNPVRREREALYAAIHDLDHDHETGKLADADWREMRDGLRARAIELLRQEQAAPQGPARSEAAASEGRAAARSPGQAEAGAARREPDCPACGAPAAADARFCAQCGRPLAAVASRASG